MSETLNTDQVESTPHKREKKSKSRKERSTSTADTQAEIERKENSGEVEEVDEEQRQLAQTKKDKKKKRKSTTTGTENLEESPEKVEKKKRKRSEGEDAVEEADAPEPKTKKSKNKTGFADPRKDSNLSDQAQKALSYAFAQFRHPLKWKFHKARQNWLVRNVWSTEAVPETYMTLVCAYLANMKGAARENLVKTCNSILEVQPEKDPEPPTAAETPATTGTATTDTPAAPTAEIEKKSPVIDEAKQSRARALLATLNPSEDAQISPE